MRAENEPSLVDTRGQGLPGVHLPDRDQASNQGTEDVPSGHIQEVEKEEQPRTMASSQESSTSPQAEQRPEGIATLPSQVPNQEFVSLCPGQNPPGASPLPAHGRAI